MTIRNLFTFLLFFCAVLSAKSQTIKAGKWQGEIHYQERSVPFDFEVNIKNGVAEVTVINGSARELTTKADIVGDSIFIALEPFDTDLVARFTETTMTGEWQKHYRNTSIPFTAIFGKERFLSTKARNQISPKWQINFQPSMGESYPGIGQWNQSEGNVTGTVMTEVSDFRYFDGVITKDSIKISSFDGAHAFLMLGAKTHKGWSGTFYFDNSYTESWEAVADQEASLPDPWSVVTVEPGIHRPFYDILSAGDEIKLDESKYFNKVLVIQLFGTWCPNSLDETKYLIEWYKKNSDLPVEILAVSYEANYSQAYGKQRIEEYRKALDVPYEIVLGGRLSKGQAAVAFPFMDKIQAFPTLVIVDKMGFVRYVHSYFNGPATGNYYQDFDGRFNAIITELVAE